MSDSTVEFETEWCSVTVNRTKRKKSLAIRVKHDRVQLNVPKSTTAVEVQLLLEQKKSWIKQALQNQRHAAQHTHKHCVPEELYRFLGQDYPLQCVIGDDISVVISPHGDLVVTAPDFTNRDRLFHWLLDWYQKEAFDYLVRRTTALAEKMGLSPSHIQVKSYRARWGSCSVRGEISYNWRLIMAPKAIVDYVVIHELCHLVEHNHSPRFWQLVSTFDRDYQTHRRWLKQHGSKLDILQV